MCKCDFVLSKCFSFRGLAKLARIVCGGAVEVESGDPEGKEGQAGCGGAGDHLLVLVLID